MNNVVIKTELLSHGVALTQRFLENYRSPYLKKRRAYGNPDPKDVIALRIPQELYLLPDRLIVATNVRHESPWKLDFYKDFFYLVNGDNNRIKVDFPLTPNFYKSKMKDGSYVSQYITLYGGSALGIFVFGGCSFIEKNLQCKFCSLSINKQRNEYYKKIINEEQVSEALGLAMEDNSVNISAIMINGGNLKSIDVNFKYYAKIAIAACKVLDKLNKNIKVHLIVYPPKELTLIDILKDWPINIIFNTEVFSNQLFEKLCPGKAIMGGHAIINKALDHAVKVCGLGRVFSIVIGGLENINVTCDGIHGLSKRCIVPIVNILHKDPGTTLEKHIGPTPEEIFKLGECLQTVYDKFGFNAGYSGFGRNSIDMEAQLKMFF